jgi:hypothetical protein
MITRKIDARPRPETILVVHVVRHGPGMTNFMRADSWVPACYSATIYLSHEGLDPIRVIGATAADCVRFMAAKLQSLGWTNEVLWHNDGVTHSPIADGRI